MYRYTIWFYNKDEDDYAFPLLIETKTHEEALDKLKELILASKKPVRYILGPAEEL